MREKSHYQIKLTRTFLELDRSIPNRSALVSSSHSKRRLALARPTTLAVVLSVASDPPSCSLGELLPGATKVNSKLFQPLLGKLDLDLALHPPDDAISREPNGSQCSNPGEKLKFCNVCERENGDQ